MRGIDFHPHDDEPLLVTGGDDYKIKVWDCADRLFRFTFVGHLGWVRTVEFHPNPSEYPWILSASDDQTLRIWDYHRQACLAMLVGHYHQYVFW